jgi:protein TonB
MEDTLQPLEAVQIKPNKYLILGIAVSVLLHLACAFLLMGQPAGSPAPSPAVTYIDLNAPQHPAPITVPSKETTPPKSVQELRLPQVSENPPQATQPEDSPAKTAESTKPAAPAAPAAPAETGATAALETRMEEQRSHSTMGLGLTKGYFKSLGEGETLREDVRGYYLEMLQGINEKWWMDQQLDKRRIDPVVVSITVARNGEIIGSEIIRGSGNPRFDKAVLAAVAAASPLPPLPASYEEDFFQAPIRLVPPLNLMAW